MQKSTYFQKHIEIMIKIRDVAARLNALAVLCVPKHTRKLATGRTVKVKGYCRKDPTRRGSSG